MCALLLRLSNGCGTLCRALGLFLLFHILTILAIVAYKVLDAAIALEYEEVVDSFIEKISVVRHDD